MALVNNAQYRHRRGEDSCCGSGGCCADFCSYCGEYFGSFFPPPVRDVGTLFKFNNVDFSTTLPKASVVLTWIISLAYIFGAVSVLSSADDDTTLWYNEFVKTMDPLSAKKAADFVHMAIVVSFIMGIPLAMLFNYVTWWASKTENKCWLLVLAVGSLLQTLNVLFVTNTRQMSILLMLKLGVPIHYVLPGIVGAIVTAWLGVMMLCAGCRATGPHPRAAAQPGVQMARIPQQGVYDSYNGGPVIVAQVVTAEAAAGVVVEDAKPLELTQINLA